MIGLRDEVLMRRTEQSECLNREQPQVPSINPSVVNPLGHLQAIPWRGLTQEKGNSSGREEDSRINFYKSVRRRDVEMFFQGFWQINESSPDRTMVSIMYESFKRKDLSFEQLRGCQAIHLTWTLRGMNGRKDIVLTVRHKCLSVWKMSGRRKGFGMAVRIPKPSVKQLNC